MGKGRIYELEGKAYIRDVNYVTYFGDVYSWGEVTYGQAY